MARTESVITIFLASPGDVAEERNRLNEVVVTWNRTWARNLGVRLELLRWEDDAYPDIGEDAQDVINTQIPQDYDLFVGLMWTRFGTPTPRAGSGTKEEFELALARYKLSPNEVSILFYFKNTPIEPSKLDPEQLKKLLNFKASLGDEGVLHWNFSTSEQFEKLISMHITKHVQKWRQKSSSTNPAQQTRTQVTPPGNGSNASTDVLATVEEDGYLDLVEMFEKRTTEVTDISNRLAAAQKELTAHTSYATQELQALSGPSPADAKKIIGKVADEMLQFTNCVNTEVPLFRAAMSGSIATLIRVATLSAEFSSPSTEAVKTAAKSLLYALRDARESMGAFKASTVGLPGITTSLNLAKRKQATALSALIAEFENGEQLLTEAIAVLDALVSGDT